MRSSALPLRPRWQLVLTLRGDERLAARCRRLLCCGWHRTVQKLEAFPSAPRLATTRGLAARPLWTTRRRLPLPKLLHTPVLLFFLHGISNCPRPCFAHSSPRFTRAHVLAGSPVSHIYDHIWMKVVPQIRVCGPSQRSGPVHEIGRAHV